MLIAAFGAMVSLQSSGDYMKWMVDPSSISSATSVDSHITGGNATVALANMKNYQYAALVASDSQSHSPDANTWSVAVYNTSTAQSSYVGDASDAAPVLAKSVFADGSTIALANIGSDYSSKYFYIELFDAAGQLVGYSEAISGSDLLVTGSELAKYKETSRFAADWANTSAWDGGKFTAVPEPTGGLMILLGAGLIGLRRKKFI